MPHSTRKPDLGRANGTAPDRGAPSGHTPADHAEPRRPPQARSKLPDHADPTEKARPHDTGRSGA
jgi:hypothetical protein